MIKSLKPWRAFCKDLIQSRNDANVIISYPKSGRTWHRAALGRYLANAYDLDSTQSLDTRFITHAAGLPLTSYSHNGANFLSDINPDHFLNGNSLLWRNKSVLLLVRDPRAILVSSFHHMTSRSKKFEGTLSEFIRHPHTGIEKILVAYNRWHKLGRLSPRFMVQSYEGMHANHRAALSNALEFIGVNELNELAIDEALSFTTFDNLKKLENLGYFQHKSMNQRNVVPEGQKVREGKVDGYKRSLSSSDLDFIQLAVTRVGNPFEEAIENAVVGDQQT
jgi:Sulfotransferase domain